MGMVFNPITGQFDIKGSGGGGGGSLTGVIPTNSINFSVSGGTDVTGDVNLSAMGADSGNTIVDLTIEADGIRGQVLNASIKSAALDLQGPVSLLDNNMGTAFSYPVANTFTFIKYSLVRNGSYRCGNILVTNDATTPAIADNGFAELGTVGVTFLAAINAGNVEIQYITSNTGFPATLKYSITQWS